MHIFFLSLLLSFSVTCRAAISGPFLFWGHEKVLNLQPKALIEATEEDFVSLFRESKSVVVFVRNSTGNRLDSFKYPKFQSVIQHSAWSYLPQKTLAAEPFDYNDNIEVHFKCESYM